MAGVRPGITLKLFLAILAASAAAAAAMAVATRLSFQSGFFGYLNQVEAQRLDALTATLAAEYRRHGDWGFVRDNYARLRELAAPAQPIQRLALLDEARRRVVGNPELPEDAAVRPVIVDDRIVGWIGQAPFRRLSMADVSQELRTPLAIVKGELEAIEDGVRPLSRESLASLNHEVAALGKLVDYLYQLALADVGALAYRKEPVEITQLLQEAVDSLGERFNERRLSVETDLAPARAFADGDRLTQAFRNLRENSLRYTDAGGRVPIGARRHAGKIRIVVEDSDPGVPAQAMPHLFERFYRVDGSRSRANGGAGLGLAICRSIVEAHDGEINARSSPLGGLAVEIELPVAQ